MLEISVRTLGEHHSDTLKAMNDLGWTWIRLKKFDEGEEMLKNALIGRERVIGKDNPWTRDLRQG